MCMQGSKQRIVTYYDLLGWIPISLKKVRRQIIQENTKLGTCKHHLAAKKFLEWGTCTRGDNGQIENLHAKGGLRFNC